jgi:molybdopterin-guanine dinucleotide biosynthesis protein A
MEEKLILILAGGQSRRMGRDKAALPFGGETMLTSLVHRYGARYPVAVSVGEPGRYDTAGAPELVDLHPGQGPLAGLEAAFVQTEAELVFLTGTDLPFGSLELAEELLRRGEEDPSTLAWVIRRGDGKTEPLCGVYRRGCLGEIQACLLEGRRSFRALFQRIPVRYVEERELPGFDLAHLLDNLNTPEDYERAVTGTN